MIIKKKLNNNVVLTKDETNRELVVVGKGIAYNKKLNDEIDQSKVVKIFVPESKGEKNRILEMIQEIPIEYLNVTKKIISYTRGKYQLILNESIYIALTDHLLSSVERHKKGIVLKNKFQWEMKRFYPNEFDVGLYGIRQIQENFGITLSEEEAGFIAMHVVSCEIGDDMEDFYSLTHFIHQLTNIIKYYFNIHFDEESLDYYRFITHLKFFWLRINNDKGNEFQNLENDILEVIKNKRVKAYLCSLKVKEFIEKNYGYQLDNEEILYLTIHISRLTNDTDTEEKK